MNNWIIFLAIWVTSFTSGIYSSQGNPALMSLQLQSSPAVESHSLKRQTNGEDPDADDKCLICFENFEKNHLQKVRFNCEDINGGLSNRTHDFCSHCILRWAKSEMCTPCCPICRGNMYVHQSIRRSNDRSLIVEGCDIRAISNEIIEELKAITCIFPLVNEYKPKPKPKYILSGFEGSYSRSLVVSRGSSTEQNGGLHRNSGTVPRKNDLPIEKDTTKVTKRNFLVLGGVVLGSICGYLANKFINDSTNKDILRDKKVSAYSVGIQPLSPIALTLKVSAILKAFVKVYEGEIRLLLSNDKSLRESELRSFLKIKFDQYCGAPFDNYELKTKQSLRLLRQLEWYLGNKINGAKGSMTKDSRNLQMHTLLYSLRTFVNVLSLIEKQIFLVRSKQI